MSCERGHAHYSQDLYLNNALTYVCVASVCFSWGKGVKANVSYGGDQNHNTGPAL